LIDVFADGYGDGSPERESLGRHVWNSSNSTGDEFSREGKEMSKIVDGTDILGPYLALSYQWGSHSYDGYITTNSNLLARKLNIVENELPKTFQHAIHAARRLGVRYLSASYNTLKTTRTGWKKVPRWDLYSGMLS
jgi:hypothetical protein